MPRLAISRFFCSSFGRLRASMTAARFQTFYALGCLLVKFGWLSRELWTGVAALSMAALMAGGAAQAQTAHLLYSQSTVGSGLFYPEGLAVDGSGNVYIGDFDNNRVVKETPSPLGYIQSLVADGLNHPQGVAVDGSGNVYIVDSYNNRVLKETLSTPGTYSQSTVASGLNNPDGVAVDGSGSVYIADVGNFRILKETLSTSGLYSQSTIGSGLGVPQGVAVDGSGNVYIVAGTSSQVFLETLSASGTYSQSAIGSGLNHPIGVAVDGSGNVYVADSGSGRVWKETLSPSGSYSQSTYVSGLFEPQVVAVDGNGNVFVAVLDRTNPLRRFTTGGANFYSVTLGQTSASEELTFTFDTAGTLGGYAVSTQGAIGLDFQAAPMQSATACTAGHNYSAGDTCTVDVVFAPTAAGTRYGSVTLYDSNENAIATGFVYGTGTGPQITFSPAVQSTIASGLSSPQDVAIDASGSMYIADTKNNRVLKETPSTSGGYTQITVGSGLNAPYGVAVDGSGNVYIGDTNNGQVLKETLSGSGSYSQSTVVSGLSSPAGVAVDASGDVYIAESNNKRVLRETLSSTGSYSQSTVASALDDPSAVAVDAIGNVYIADTENGRVLKETLSPAGSYSQSTVASGLSYPYGVAVDGNGNVYIADTRNNRVLEETPSASGSYNQSTVSNGLSNPSGVVVDGGGNVYIADTNNSRVLKEDFVDAPRLSFADTAVGSNSAAQTVIVTNIGNAPLTLPLPLSGQNPSLSSYFTLSNSSTCPSVYSNSLAPGTLAAGASCTEVLSYTPTLVGAVTGNLVFTDNNQNATGSTQTVVMTGSSVQSLTVTAVSQNVPAGTSSVTLGFTVGWGGNTAPTGTPTLTVNGSSNGVGGVNCTAKLGHSNCSATYNTSTLLPGTYTITATQPANGSYSTASGTATLTVTVTAVNHVATLVRSSSPVVVPQPNSSAISSRVAAR